MNRYWNFSRDQGSMPSSLYAYTGFDETCKHDDAQIVVRAGTAGQITSSLTDAKIQLQSGPLTIAVAAGNSCWQYYSSGILSGDNNCPNWIDHAVTVVGLGSETETKTVTTGDVYRWYCRSTRSRSCAAGQRRIRRRRRTYCCDRTLVEAGETTT